MSNDEVNLPKDGDVLDEYKCLECGHDRVFREQWQELKGEKIACHWIECTNCQNSDDY